MYKCTCKVYRQEYCRDTGNQCNQLQGLALSRDRQASMKLEENECH